MLRKCTVIGLAIVCALSMTMGTVASAAGDKEKPRESAISWPAGQALPSFSKVKELDVADIYDAPGDIKLLMATLQGVVNRVEPRVYLLENKEEGKFTWLNDLDVKYKVRDDYWQIVRTYAKEINGIIVYDPKIPDSVNVATTLAGLKGAVVASPDLATKLQAAPYSLKVLDDLQGKFKDRLDAYTWQYENLWSQTTKRMIVGLNPQTSIRLPDNQEDLFTVLGQDTTQERDGANKNVYDFDLSESLGGSDVYLRFGDAFPQDGWGTAVHEVTVKADGEAIAQFIAGSPEEEAFLYDSGGSQVSEGQGGHRFADNGRYFIYKFTPPAGTKQLTASVELWNQYKVSVSSVQPVSSEQKEPYGYLRDYAVANKAMVFWLDSNVPEQRELFEKILSDVEPGTPYLGWFSNDVDGEFSGVEITSNHGVYVLAADWFSNLTVFSGTKANKPKPVAVQTPKLENKIYVTYTFSEGDNFQYNQHRMRILWDDPSRGKVPLNWTSSPLLYDAAPAMLNYFNETATANDQIIAGPSGAGYFYPNAWPAETFSAFLKQSYSYMEKTGMTIPYVLNRIDSQNVPLDADHAAAYMKEYKPAGMFLSWEDRHGVELIGDGKLPVSTIHGISTAQDGKTILENAKANWDGKSPMFVSLGLLAWSLTPSDIAELQASLGPEFAAVRADQYFSLIRSAHGLPAKP